MGASPISVMGCGLRRAELTALRAEDIQRREEHWVIADLVSKGGHIRTVPVPDRVKTGIGAWTTAAGITTGTLLRSINKAGRIWGSGLLMLRTAHSVCGRNLGKKQDRQAALPEVGGDYLRWAGNCVSHFCLHDYLYISLAPVLRRIPQSLRQVLWI